MTLAGLPRACAISNLHYYKQNVHKMRGLLKKWVLTGKQFEDFRQKNSKIPLLPWRTKQKNHKTPGAKTEHESCSQGGINWSEIEKAFRMKLFELCKTRTKKSSPDLFNFNVISAGHGVTNDDDRATTCRRNFKAPWLQTERTKNEGPSEKMSFNGETF